MSASIADQLRSALIQQLFPNEQVSLSVTFQGLFLAGIEEEPSVWQKALGYADLYVCVTSSRILVAKAAAIGGISVETIPWTVISSVETEEQALAACLGIREKDGRVDFFSAGWNAKSEIRSLYRTIRGYIDSREAQNQPRLNSRQMELERIVDQVVEYYSNNRHLDVQTYAGNIKRRLAADNTVRQEETDYFVERLCAKMNRFL